MEKMLILALFLALLLTGCGSGGVSGRAERRTLGQETAGQRLPGQPDDSLEAREDLWGLALKAEDVTPTGLNLHLIQSGGQYTGELETGSYFWLERESGGAWTEVEPLTEDLAWTMEAYLIQPEGDTEMEVKWSALYGELPTGSYRLGKTVMDFRGTGDYDQQIYYAHFTVA